MTNHTFQIIFHQLKIQVTKTPIKIWTTVLDTTQSTAITIRQTERKKERKKEKERKRKQKIKKETKKLTDLLTNFRFTGKGAKEADHHTAR